MLALYLALAARDADRVRDGVRLLGEGRPAAAAQRVQDVGTAPAEGHALVVRAFAARALGDRRGAERLFAAAVRARPDDWAIRRARAVNLARLGRRERARRELARALRLNPLMPVPRGVR
jgi:Flp pilus assembly protein TadD